MNIKLRFWAGIAAGLLLLGGCGGEAPSSAPAESLPQGWEAHHYAAPSFEADFSLPADWSLRENSLLDPDGQTAGRLDLELSQVSPSGNANDFYMVLELSGLVPQKPVAGSRRKAGEPAFFCQQYYLEELPAPGQVVYEYYLPAGEESCLRMELYAAGPDDPDTQAEFDAIAASVRVEVKEGRESGAPAEQSSSVESGTAPQEMWQPAAYDVERIWDLSGDYIQESGVRISMEIPTSWQLEDSILWKTDLNEDEEKAAYEGRLKVGEIGSVIQGLSSDITADEIFELLGRDGDSPKTYLEKALREENGRTIYYAKWQSFPGGGAVETWYPHEYLLETENGFVMLLFYTLQENDPEAEAVFDSIAASVTTEPLEDAP